MGDDSSQETQVPNGKSNHLLYRTVKNRADFFVCKNNLEFVILCQIFMPSTIKLIKSGKCQ